MLKCKEELERHGVEVVCNRTSDVEILLPDKCEKVNNSGADIAVSFHANAGLGDGFEVFYYTTSENGKKLAALCEKHVKTLGQNSRGLKSGNHLYFVKNTTMPAVLVESAFLDHITDKQIIDTKAEQEKFGVAYAKAILEYFGIAWTEPKEADVLYKVQVGAFSIRKNAESLKRTLEALGYDPFIVEVKR